MAGEREDESVEAHPTAPESRRRTPPGSSLWLRALLTLAPVASVVLAGRITIPGVDHERFAAYGVTPPTLIYASVSVFAAVSLVVEAIVALVPSWSASRLTKAATRARIFGITVTLAMVLAAYGSYEQTRYLDDTGLLVASPVFIATTLVGATAFMIGAAELASRRGLGNGYVIALVTGELASWAGDRKAGLLEASSLTPFAKALFVAAALGIVGFSIAALRGFLLAEPRDDARPRDAGYRAATPPAAVPIALPTPTSGIGALAVVTTLFAIRSISRNTGMLVAMAGPALIPALTLAIALGVGAAIAALANAPVRVAIVAARAARSKDTDRALALARPRIRAGLWQSLAVLAAFVALDQVRVALALHVPPTTEIAVAVLGGLLVDVLREVRFRRAHADTTIIWTEHRAYAAAALERALAEEGIPALARNRDQRTLLQICGPFVPIEICVPTRDAARAAAIAKRALAPRKNDAELRKKLRESRTAGAGLSGTWKSFAVLVGGCVVSFGALAGPALLRDDAPRRKHHSPTTKLAFVEVDDGVDPLARFAREAANELPAGVRIEVESAPVGESRTSTVHFAKILPLDGETLDRALQRTRPFFEHLQLPDGETIGFEKAFERDETTERMVQIGYRTFLLTQRAALDERDVADAHATLDASSGAMEHWIVMLEFTAPGAKKFETYTADHLQKRFAIVADGLVMSAPVIQSKISGGSAQITMGGGSLDQQQHDAEALARGLGGD